MAENYDASYRYFENHDCRFYPCHEGSEHINCLFCYCPLYFLPHCPGNQKTIRKPDGIIKSCVDCRFPHEAENYDKIMMFLRKYSIRNQGEE